MVVLNLIIFGLSNLFAVVRPSSRLLVPSLPEWWMFFFFWTTWWWFCVTWMGLFCTKFCLFPKHRTALRSSVCPCLSFFFFQMILYLFDIMMSQLCRHLTAPVTLSHVNIAYSAVTLSFFQYFRKFWHELNLQVFELFWHCFKSLSVSALFPSFLLDALVV